MSPQSSTSKGGITANLKRQRFIVYSLTVWLHFVWLIPLGKRSPCPDSRPAEVGAVPHKKTWQWTRVPLEVHEAPLAPEHLTASPLAGPEGASANGLRNGYVPLGGHGLVFDLKRVAGVRQLDGA